jgi:hypothetical protein
MSLILKLVEVMKSIPYIQKAGFNSFHKYRYASEADVNERVREEFAKRNLVMIPDVKSCTVRPHVTHKGHHESITTVEVEFKIIDGDTGETISFTTFGEGQDAGDKGIYKAITGAQKYALMKMLMIPTGDDPEADERTDEQHQTQDTESLKAKFMIVKGTTLGFEEWLKKSKQGGLTLTQIDQALDKKIEETLEKDDAK